MNFLLVVGAVVLVVALLAVWWMWRSLSGGHARRPPADPAEVYQGLRNQILNMSVEELGIEVQGDVWGVLMEMGLTEGSATLVSLADGTTSLYLSSGGGILGGHAHENVRTATLALVAQAGRHCQGLPQATSYPLPSPGRVKFYVLTKAGVLCADEDEEELGRGDHELSPLFGAGHEVIGQLRTITEHSEN